MEQVAEMGVTAHWVYKEGGKNDSTTAQVRAQRWLQSLVDIQQNVGNSFEFIEMCIRDRLNIQFFRIFFYAIKTRHD